MEFASEYRNCFVDLANNYYKTYDRFDRSGNIDHALYVWLTKNANRIQGMLGASGRMEYIAPYRTSKVSNYEIIINTIPKFRDGNVTESEVNSADDCLLRYIGIIEEIVNEKNKQLKNPFILLKTGFKEFFSLPIYIINWFGIIPNKIVGKITSNSVFNVTTGIAGFVAFVSGIVTIIQGKEQTIAFLKDLLKK